MAGNEGQGEDCASFEGEIVWSERSLEGLGAIEVYESGAGVLVFEVTIGLMQPSCVMKQWSPYSATALPVRSSIETAMKQFALHIIF